MNANYLLKTVGSLSLFLILRSNAQDVVNFTNHIETITNSIGVVIQAEFLRADLDGIFYRVAGGAGRLSFTNMSPAKLESLGIPTNRIAIAVERAAIKAAADRRYKAWYEAEAAKVAEQRAAQAAEDEKQKAAIEAEREAEEEKVAEKSRKFWGGVQQRRENNLADKIAKQNPLQVPP